ncbi:toprim domain-containing protein [Deferrisoma camini]|uniref:toprim domain-containing protein n=1 Tax=Deferrisoma camini TaxID=1035120 RepID=UPI00046CF15E|nr:toprim domain-containing protein [Deferrisoma camini]
MVHSRATLGGAVRLFAPADGLAVAEGIETALAVHALTDRPAWAALSAGGVERMVLPTTIREVLVAADNDPSGVGQRAGDALAGRLFREGRKVLVAVPPKPCHGSP